MANRQSAGDHRRTQLRVTDTLEERIVPKDHGALAWLRQQGADDRCAQRQAGLRSIYAALNALQDRNRASRWVPSVELQTALNDLYNLPNLDISADANTLSPVFAKNLVTSGPVYRKGYWSQVTAGVDPDPLIASLGLNPQSRAEELPPETFWQMFRHAHPSA